MSILKHLPSCTPLFLLCSRKCILYVCASSRILSPEYPFIPLLNPLAESRSNAHISLHPPSPGALNPDASQVRTIELSIIELTQPLQPFLKGELGGSGGEYMTSGSFGDSILAAARPKRWGVSDQDKRREFDPTRVELFTLLDGACYKGYLG
jgi:hypothetical protein